MSAETVWLAEYEEYDCYGPSVIAATKEDAIELVKAPYTQPYIVRWEVEEDDGGCYLKGHFEMVPGKSTKHVGTWSITEHPVQRFSPGEGDEGA